MLRIRRTLIAIVLLTLVATAAASTSLPAPPAVGLSYVAHHDHEPPSTTTSAATTTVAPTTTTTETATTTTAEETTTTVEPEPETTVTTRARRPTTVSPTVAPVVETTVAETTAATTVPETVPVAAPDPGDGSLCRTGPAFDAHACELIAYRGDFTPEEVQALVARAFPGEERKALSVASCETGRTWNRFVHNPSGARGIMQVMSSWRPRFEEITGLPYYYDVFEVGPNLVFSVWLRNTPGSGWGNWSCR